MDRSGISTRDKSWLSRPYPGFSHPGRDSIQIVGIGLLFGTAVLLARPFGSQVWPQDVLPFIVGRATVLAIATALVNRLVLPKLWPKLFLEDSWDVKRQILFECWHVVSVAVAIGAGIHGFQEMTLSLATKYLVFTSLAAVVPVSTKVLLTEIYWLRRNLRQLALAIPDSSTVAASAEHGTREGKWIELQIDHENALSLETTSIRHISAQQNYCRVEWLAGEKLHRKLVRQRIISLEEQLAGTNCFRVHRSHLVNLDAVLKISGNARGYRLTVMDLASDVPLSRSYSKQVLPRLRNLVSLR